MGERGREGGICWGESLIFSDSQGLKSCPRGCFSSSRRVGEFLLETPRRVPNDSLLVAVAWWW